MGLNMIVGMLVDSEDDHTGVGHAHFVAINELLERAGARQWTEPDLVEEQDAQFEMWGYSGLHTVRRLAVHLAAGGPLPEPLDEAGHATDDPLLSKAYATFPGDPPGPFDHLIYHSDCEGYYVPVDFAHVIVDPKAPGGCIGSSVRLLAETRRLAEALGLPEDLDPYSGEILEVIEAIEAGEPVTGGWQRYAVESHVCLQLLQASKLSVATGTAIIFA